MTNEMSEFIKRLRSRGACDAGIEFVTQYATPHAAWEACDNVSFMEWYLEKVGRLNDIAPVWRQYSAAIDEAERQYRAVTNEAADEMVDEMADEARRQYRAVTNGAWWQYCAVEDEALRQYARDIRQIIPIIPALT